MLCVFARPGARLKVIGCFLRCYGVTPQRPTVRYRASERAVSCLALRAGQVFSFQERYIQLIFNVIFPFNLVSIPNRSLCLSNVLTKPAVEVRVGLTGTIRIRAPSQT